MGTYDDPIWPRNDEEVKRVAEQMGRKFISISRKDLIEVLKALDGVKNKLQGVLKS